MKEKIKDSAERLIGLFKKEDIITMLAALYLNEFSIDELSKFLDAEYKALQETTHRDKYLKGDKR